MWQSKDFFIYQKNKELPFKNIACYFPYYHKSCWISVKIILNNLGKRKIALCVCREIVMFLAKVLWLFLKLFKYIFTSKRKWSLQFWDFLKNAYTLTLSSNQIQNQVSSGIGINTHIHTHKNIDLSTVVQTPAVHNYLLEMCFSFNVARSPLYR